MHKQQLCNGYGIKCSLLHWVLSLVIMTDKQLDNHLDSKLTTHMVVTNSVASVVAALSSGFGVGV